MIVQNLSLETFINIDKNNGTPVYQQIANCFINIIREGMLKPGTRIPSSREMAVQLKVHRKTIIAAYDELIAQDWIDALPRKGMIVSRKLPEFKPRDFQELISADSYQSEHAFAYKQIRLSTSLSMPRSGSHRIIVNDGFPDARIAPIDSLFRHYKLLLKKSYVQGLFMHGDAQGSAHLRYEIAKFLGNTRSLNIDPDNILLTRGAQAAIFIAASMILKPGDTVIVGEPNYLFANKVFTHFNAKLVPVKIDEQGIDVDEIEMICKKKKPALLYIIPHHHHPTTVTLSSERRMKLLHIIRTYKLPVIEDDYDYDFHYNKSPILPLASADHRGLVMYIGSLTKSFASAIRVGYLIGQKDFVYQASGLKEMMDIRGDILMEEALALLYKNGEMQKHLNKAVKLYHQRRDLFCEMLEQELNGMVKFNKPLGGMSVWVKFCKPYNLLDIANEVLKDGILMNNGQAYNTGDQNYNALRMGFASMNEMEMLELISALKKLK